MGTKKVNYDSDGINRLPNNKPVLYTIETASGNPNYIGIAGRGNVRQRISDHLGEIPGVKVRIEQFSRIADAEKKETNVIKRDQPKYNRQKK